MSEKQAKKQPTKGSKPKAGLPKLGKPSPRKASTGVVVTLVRGRSGKEAASRLNPSNLVEELRIGLPVGELEDLQASLGVPMEKLSSLLGISKSTLHRRKTAQRLGTAESDRVIRFARLMSQAVEVLESEERARLWLSSAQFGLGGAVPLEYAETEVGAREVEDLLGRIEYSVYS